MNQRQFDEAVVNAQVRFQERLMRWNEKWLGERLNYGSELGSILQSGVELPSVYAEAGEAEATLPFPEETGREAAEETDLYGQEE